MHKSKLLLLITFCLILLSACENGSLLGLINQEPELLSTPTPELNQEQTEQAQATSESTTSSSADSDDSTSSLNLEAITSDIGVVKIGYMGPLSGGAAAIGKEQLAYMQAVVDLYVQKTGLDIEIIAEDTELSPEVGATIAQRFADDPDIIGVVGPASSQVCEAAQPVFQNANLAHITPSCTKTDLTNPGTETFFRPIPTDADQSRAIAAHMIATSNVYKLHILEDQSSYASVLSDELSVILLNSGIRIERSSFTQEETNFMPIVEVIVKEKPDAVFLVAQIENQKQDISVELHKNGFDGFVYMPDTGFTSGWVEAAGEAAEKTYVTFFAPDPNLVPEADLYNQAYRSMFESDPTPFGGAAGMASQVMLQSVIECVEIAGTSRDCIISRLNFTQLDNTLLGIPISFQQGNQSKGVFSLFQIQEGEFNLLTGVGDPGLTSE